MKKKWVGLKAEIVNVWYVWNRTSNIMSKFLINLIIKFGRSESLRKAALTLLKDLAAKSDNDVDDAIVKMIEEKLFPVK